MSARTPIAGVLSAELRSATHEVHEQARHSPYLAALIGGSLPLDAYTLLAEQYSAIYGALEAATDAMVDHPVAGAFVIDELRRLPALHADLDALGSGVPRILPSTTRYVERLHTAATDPERFVAHHYIRYLGDLSGGQIVATMLRRTYGLSGDGARFYDFSALGAPPRFKARYRALLDATRWSAAARARVADEAVHAFALNVAVMSEMADEAGLDQPLAS